MRYDLRAMAKPSQKLAVFLAFLAAAASLAAFVVRYAKTGEIGVTPLFGGLLMLVLGISGMMRLRGGPQ